MMFYLFCYGLGLGIGFFIFVLGTYFSLGHVPHISYIFSFAITLK